MIDIGLVADVVNTRLSERARGKQVTLERHAQGGEVRVFHARLIRPAVLNRVRKRLEEIHDATGRNRRRRSQTQALHRRRASDVATHQLVPRRVFAGREEHFRSERPIWDFQPGRLQRRRGWRGQRRGWDLRVSLARRVRIDRRRRVGLRRVIQRQLLAILQNSIHLRVGRRLVRVRRTPAHATGAQSRSRQCNHRRSKSFHGAPESSSSRSTWTEILWIGPASHGKVSAIRGAP